MVSAIVRRGRAILALILLLLSFNILELFTIADVHTIADNVSSNVPSSDKAFDGIKRPSEQERNETSQERIPEKHKYPFEFAACLMVKDDNIILPEWLAYHYTVLPLRYLIVAVDPLSVTSPEPILDLYRNYTNLKIETWTGNWWWRIESWEDPEMSPPKTDENIVTVKRQRQWDFYNYCLLRLKNLNHTWTTIIDSDEYFTYNTPMAAENKYSAKDIKTLVLTRETREQLLPKTVGQQNETIAHWIRTYGERNGKIFKNRGLSRRKTVPLPKFEALYSKSTFCAAAPRIQFFSKYVRNMSAPFGLPSDHRNLSFQREDFHTLEYTAHDILTGGSFNGPEVLPCKTIMNAAHMKPEYKAKSPHILYTECEKKAKWNAEIMEGWPFRVHQYSGSLKTFVSRPERTAAMWEARNQMKFENNYDDSLTLWFPRFARLLRRQNGSDDGMALAHRLTQQAHDDAYSESMSIKHRILILNETVAPLYRWEKPLEEDEKMEMTWYGLDTI